MVVYFGAFFTGIGKIHNVTGYFFSRNLNVAKNAIKNVLYYDYVSEIKTKKFKSNLPPF